MLLAFKGCLLKGCPSLLKQAFIINQFTASGMSTCHIHGIKIPIWKRDFQGTNQNTSIGRGLLWTGRFGTIQRYV